MGTNLVGKETVCHMIVRLKADRNDSLLPLPPHPAMLAAQDVAQSARSWLSLLSTRSPGPQQEIGPRPLDQRPSQLSCPLGMKMAQVENVTLSSPTAPAGREVTMVIIS